MNSGSNHLRFADKSGAIQRAALLDMVTDCPPLYQAFRGLRDMNLPDCWVVSGAIYNQVWNALSGRPNLYGVKDIDIFYFDPDTSYEAEDRIIRRAKPFFPDQPPVEIRNQARVHLWYEHHFGEAYPALGKSTDAIDRFASKTHCIGLRLRKDDTFDIYAPFGLNDIFSFRVTPNPVQNNRKTHERKSRRQKKLWPELEIVPWPK